MPAKTSADLENRCVICIHKPGGYWITIAAEPPKTSDTYVSPPTEMTIFVQAINDLWRVVEVEAEHGWGPFLYDLAIELATQNGGRLTGHEHRMTDASQAVWQQYLDHRSDVDRKPLDEFCIAALPATLRSSLQKPPTTIEELKRLNKWHEVRVSG